MHLINRKSIFTKILLLMIVVSIISGTLILSISLAEQTSAMEENIIQHHVVLADVASQSIEAGYHIQRWPFATLKEIGECGSVLFWWIVTPDGEILLADDTGMWGKQINDESLGTTETVVKDSAFPETGENIKLIAHPLDMKEKGEQWTFYLGVSLESVADSRNKMIIDGVSLFSIILVVVIFISFYFTKTVTGPITELTEGAKAISQGHLDYEIKIKSEDEIGGLANAFNKMTTDLKKSRGELEDYSKNLEKEVDDRTKELNEKVMKLEKSETATFNMMQDLKQTMTELERIKNEIERQNIKLKKLNSIKSVFLNVTSHELRTPLSGIKGYVQMTLDQAFGKITDEQKDALELILQNTDHLNHIVQDILDSSHIQAGTMKFVPKETNIEKMVNEAVGIMQPSAKLRDIEITSDIKPDIPELFIDNERVKQVITNLIGNAIKFSPEQTIIDVRAEKEKNNIKFEVQDQGRGIPKDKQKKIFEMFYQVDQGLDRQIGGVGLGLAISMGILSAHGGKIDVESPGSGKGSTFSFTLPIESIKDIGKRFKDIDLFGTKK